MNQLFINGKEVINDTFLPNQEYTPEQIKDIVFENACNMWLENYTRVKIAFFVNKNGGVKYFSNSFQGSALSEWFKEKIKRNKLKEMKENLSQVQNEINKTRIQLKALENQKTAIENNIIALSA